MNKIKLIVFLTFIFFIINSHTFSYENKILFKVNQEIITSIDIEKEYRYLIALNENMRNLSKDQIFEISKKSSLREKIKEIEIANNFKSPKVPDEYLDLLIKNIYQNINIKNEDEFKEYLRSNEIDYQYVRKKIEIEALWNELIMSKFKSKVKINENEIRESIINRKKKVTNSYLLSEILFEVTNSNELKKKYLEIKNAINEKGFDNAALSYSIANTASIGGKIGWINENSLNKKLRSIISKKKENQITEPITVPGGFLILKIDQIKEIKNDLNLDEEVKKLIKIKMNNQLSQLSIIYFNKVKKNISIDEI